MLKSSKRTGLIVTGAAALAAASAWLTADAQVLPPEAQNAPGIRGLVVNVDGKPVGGLIGYLHGLAEVDLADSAPDTGTALVGQAASLLLAPLLEVISPTGYIFHLSTGSIELPSAEGELHRRVAVYYDSPNCGGQAYLPIQAETGRFSTWELGNGRFRPLTYLGARQGLAFVSPDPADPIPAYMIRRGTPVEEVFLRSLKVVILGAVPPAAACISPPFPPAFDRAVRLEPLDPSVAGVSAQMSGAITLGW